MAKKILPVAIFWSVALLIVWFELWANNMYRLLLVSVLLWLIGIIIGSVFYYDKYNKHNKPNNANNADYWRKLAYSDELTGLLNRRGLLVRAVKVPYCLLLLDIDNFKGINDNNGHATGDAVLQYMADCLNRHTRQDDICARWGGDEFIVVLANSDRQSASAFITRLHRQLEKSRGDLPAIGVSIGRADTTQSREILELVTLADVGMLKQKHNQ